LLVRAPDAGWTLADVPLLDEAAELIGPDLGALAAEEAAAARRAQERAEELTVAREVLASTGAGAMVSAAQLVERYHGEPSRASAAEQATSDRAWTYGHVIVDEAQELTPMMWRLLMRRCPMKSMTVVGDPAQASAAGAAGSWEAALSPHVQHRYRLARLTVNYRTPAEIMEIAADVLAAAGGGTPPAAVRATGVPPLAVQADDPLSVLGSVVRGELAAVTPGRVAVISPVGLVDAVATELTAELPDAVARGSAGLDAPVAVLTPTEVKGLEFDAVVIVDPARLVAESPQGLHDLYVAVTRPTARLAVVAAGELLEPLSRLRVVEPA
jgi:superfamily I DNA/RNA helicase